MDCSQIMTRGIVPTLEEEERAEPVQSFVSVCLLLTQPRVCKRFSSTPKDILPSQPPGMCLLASPASLVTQSSPMKGPLEQDLKTEAVQLLVSSPLPSLPRSPY